MGRSLGADQTVSRLTWLLLAFVALSATFVGAQNAAALPGPAGSLFSESSGTGCVSLAQSTDCASIAPLDGATDVVLSVDGLHAYVAAQAASAVAVLERGQAGAFAASAASCVGSDAASGCAVGVGLDGVSSLALSPDGRHLYAASPDPGAVAVLRRDTASGALSQSSGACAANAVTDSVERIASVAGCLPAEGLAGASGVTVSPDGAHVYVASATADAVALLARNPLDGSLSQPAGPSACVSGLAETGPPAVGRDPECLASDAPLAGASSVVISAGGEHVYVAAPTSKTLATFSRNSSSGQLTFHSCVSADADGGAADQPTVAGCVPVRGLDGPVGMALSPDQAHLYVASSSNGSVVVLSRDFATGALSQLEHACISDPAATTPDLECAPGVGLAGASDLALSSDGAQVYVAAPDANAIAVLSRDPTSGALAQLAAPDGCLSASPVTGACRSGRRVERAGALAVSPDGRHVLVASTLGSLASLERQLRPVCAPISVAGVSGPTPVPLACSDANGDALHYRVLEAPSSGSVTDINHAAGALTYAPAAGAAGTDAFSFTASDDGGVMGTPVIASLALSPAQLAAALAPAMLADTRSPQLKAGKLVISRNKRIRIKLRCPTHEKRGCVGTMTIKTVRRIPARTLRLVKLAAGRNVTATRVKIVSKLRFKLRGATTRTISTRLRKKHARLIKRLGRTQVEILLFARDPAGNVARSKRKVFLVSSARR